MLNEDLISRRAIYEKLMYDTTETHTLSNGDYIAKWRVGEAIENAPAIEAIPKDQHLAKCKEMYEQGRFDALAEAEPVRHGRWIHDINNLYGCSECMERETMSHKRLKHYCPNCGAKMDGEYSG